MSFPKAKIHRFNDDVSCAPPPGTYDPKVNDKVKGAVLSSARRFPDQMCVSSSLDSLDKANPPPVTFTTPQIVRRKVEPTTRLKYLQDKKFDTPGSSSSSHSCDTKLTATKEKKEFSTKDYMRLEHQLSALYDQHWNELLQRDLEITKLKEELTEIKIHEEELKEVLQEKNKDAAERSRELQELRKNLDTMEDRIKKEREESQHIQSELQSQKDKLESTVLEKQSALAAISDKFVCVENELKVLREEKTLHQQELTQLEKVNSEIIEKILNETGLEIEKLESALKFKVNCLEQEICETRQKEQVEFQSRLDMVSRELKEKTMEMKNCLLKVKDLKEMVEEKSKHFSNYIIDCDKQCGILICALCEVEKERDELIKSDSEKNICIKNVQEKCKEHENHMNQYKVKCQRYEITLNTMQNTIDAVSQRLLESENEVERLNKVEFNLKGYSNNLEKKLQELLTEISLVKEGMEKMEKEIISDVTAIKEHLVAKVEHLKMEATKEINGLHGGINEKQRVINVLSETLQNVNETLSELQNLNSNHENEIIVLNDSISKFQEEVASLKKENLDLANDKVELKNKVQKNLLVIENIKEKETEQKKYIDKIISELAVVEERCSALVSEKDELKALLCQREEELHEQIQVNENLHKNAEFLEKKFVESEKVTESFRTVQLNLKKTEEENVFLRNENSTLQNQLTENCEQVSQEILAKSDTIQKLELEKKELQLLLSSAKEGFKTEISSLEHDNINKAELILELSLNIDNLKEEHQIKINCLEAEKNSLAFQFNEANKSLSTLQFISVEDKSKISSLEHENIIKTEEIAELSLHIDNLKEEYQIKINCLEAEKNKLSFQLNEANKSLSDLTLSLENKNEIIHSLTSQKNAVSVNYEDSIKEIEDLKKVLKKNAEDKKQYMLTDQKLVELEEKVTELENEVATKDRLLRKLNERLEELQGVEDLREKVEMLSIRLQQVTEDRDKANEQLTDLLGHQNIQQKIRHVNQLKQHNLELKKLLDENMIENTMLKKKLNEAVRDHNLGKENNTPRSSSKTITPKKAPLSPAVLKDRNQ